jgi:hypothetical protein
VQVSQRPSLAVPHQSMLAFLVPRPIPTLDFRTLESPEIYNFAPFRSSSIAPSIASTPFCQIDFLSSQCQDIDHKWLIVHDETDTPRSFKVIYISNNHRRAKGNLFAPLSDLVEYLHRIETSRVARNDKRISTYVWLWPINRPLILSLMDV